MHAFSLVLAVVLDQLLGELRYAHPLVGFGMLATAVEKFFRIPTRLSPLEMRIRGVVAVCLLLLPLLALTVYIDVLLQERRWIFDAIALYVAIGARSLREHAQRVERALTEDNLQSARSSVAMIVSRDTASMRPVDAARAAIESVLENGNDAIFAPIFWALLFGAPGAVLLRVSNTLDAMWGYKNERYLYFGWAAARLDDLLNWVPARLTALSYAVCGNFVNAIRCWREQGPTWYSPNAGPVMAAGAGALGVCLGGNAVYAGAEKSRPALGCGEQPQGTDIKRANDLVSRSMIIWVALAVLLQLSRS